MSIDGPVVQHMTPTTYFARWAIFFGLLVVVVRLVLINPLVQELRQARVELAALKQDAKIYLTR